MCALGAAAGRVHVRGEGALRSETSEWVKARRGPPKQATQSESVGAEWRWGRWEKKATPGPCKVTLKPQAEELAMKPGC